jgi:hypothetical protein
MKRESTPIPEPVAQLQRELSVAVRGRLVKKLDSIENAGHRQNGPNCWDHVKRQFPGRCNIVLRQVQADLSWTVGSSRNHH